jgi:hypothetical protein
VRSAIVLVVALVSGCTSAARSQSSDRAALEAAYRAQDDAIVKSNADAFMATIGPAYTVHLRNGVVLNRSQVETAIRADMQRTQSVERATSTIRGVVFRGDTADVTVAHETVRTINDATGKPRRWESGVVHREVWIRTNHAWRIHSLHELEQLYLRRDGVAL